MIEIQITKGYVALISDEDADLADFKWWANQKDKRSSRIYVARQEIGTKKKTSMHRIVLSRVLGRPLGKDEICDHIDQNPLNNQRNNLRVCTTSQNNCNAPVRSTSKTGYRGVCLDDRRSTYFAYVDIGRKRKYVGSGFSDPVEAAKARDRKAIELHGDFVALNFPRETYEQEQSS